MAVKLQKGMFLLAETKQVNNQDVFGRVLYVIRKVGLPRPLKGAKEKDGVEAEMLGGSGPAGRSGQIITDYEEQIVKLIEKGVIKVLTDAQAAELKKTLRSEPVVSKAKGIGLDTPKHSGTGVVEL